MDDILKMHPDDPFYEQTRLSVLQEMHNTRMEYMRAQARVAEWSDSEDLTTDATIALRNERSSQLTVAQQHVENLRAKFRYWANRAKEYPDKVKPSAVKAAAAAASKEGKS